MQVVTRMMMMMMMMIIIIITITIIYFSSVGEERESEPYEGKHITGISGKVDIFMPTAIAYSVWDVY
jgi:hypothetical protein